MSGLHGCRRGPDEARIERCIRRGPPKVADPRLVPQLNRRDGRRPERADVGARTCRVGRNGQRPRRTISRSGRRSLARVLVALGVPLGPPGRRQRREHVDARNDALRIERVRHRPGVPATLRLEQGPVEVGSRIQPIRACAKRLRSLSPPSVVAGRISSQNRPRNCRVRPRAEGCSAGGCLRIASSRQARHDGQTVIEVRRYSTLRQEWYSLAWRGARPPASCPRRGASSERVRASTSSLRSGASRGTHLGLRLRLAHRLWLGTQRRNRARHLPAPDADPRVIFCRR